VAAGGYNVLLRGTNFFTPTTMFCRFGLHVVTASFATATQVQCIAPAAELSTVNVEVSMNGYDYSASGITYTFDGPHFLFVFFLLFIASYAK
jgi:hypothetical protein